MMETRTNVTEEIKPKKVRKKKGKGSKPPIAFKDRVKEFRRVRAGDLQANPKNWRLHGRKQRKAFQGLLADIGFADAVIAFQAPEGLRLIDGHMRTSEVPPDTELPVLILDVNEEEADKLLATLDPLGTMAVEDREKMRELTSALLTLDKAPLPALPVPTVPLSLIGEMETEEITVPDETDYYPPEGPYGIPGLRPDRLFVPPSPLRLWTAGAEDDGGWYLAIWGLTAFRTAPVERTVVACFTYDSYFEEFWFDSAETLRTFKRKGYPALCAPEFSLWWDMPQAIRIFSVYRNRWVSRYFQEGGVPVMPGFYLPLPEDEHFAWEGNPEGAVLCSSIQNISTAEERTIAVRSLTRGVARLKPRTLWLYGGQPARKLVDAADIPATVEINFISNRYEQLRERGMFV